MASSISNHTYSSDYLRPVPNHKQKNLRILPANLESKASKPTFPDETSQVVQKTATPITEPKTQSKRSSQIKSTPRQKQITELNELGKKPTPAEFRAITPQHTKSRDARGSPKYNSYYGSRLPQTPEKDTNHGPKGKVQFKEKYTFFRDYTPENFPSSADDATFFQGDDTSLYEPSIPQPQPMSGYYIDQQKRFEEAQAVKPNMYTHRTFRDVFQAEEQNRLNPMDVVFDDPSQRELKTTKKISRAIKQVFRKNDYASYDYYQHDDTDQPESLEIRSEFGDIGSDVNTIASERTEKYEIFDSKDFREKISTETTKNVPFDSNHQSRRRWTGRGSKNGIYKDADRTFSDDESQFARENINSEVPMDKNEYASNSGPPDAANIQPLWNYLLSWIAYSDAQQGEHMSDGKITEIRDGSEEDFQSQEFENKISNVSKSQDHNRTSRNVNRSRGYKQLLRKLNTPSSEYINNRNHQRASKELPQIQAKDNSRHAFTESGFDLVKQRQYSGTQISPETKSGHIESESKISTSNQHPEAPRTIMSNVNKLIKNIRIMRVIFAPIDILAENFPQIQTFVIFIELFIFMWILYELSLLIDALCMAIKAVCAPMIAVGKFMNRIV